jgi:hypothetical protein
MREPDSPYEEYLPIDKAPSRVRREHYRRERIMSLLAIVVIATVAVGLAWGIFRLTGWLLDP